MFLNLIGKPVADLDLVSSLVELVHQRTQHAVVLIRGFRRPGHPDRVPGQQQLAQLTL